MERLSPRANGLEYVEARQLAAGDVGEAIPQQLLDAAKVVLRQAQGPGDARRCRAAMPGDGDAASRTGDAVQLVDRGFEVGPDRDVVHRDHAVDAGVGQAGAVSSTEVEPNPPGAKGLPVVPCGLIAHLRGRVDSSDARGVGAFGEQPMQTAWSVTDLEDVVAGLDPENADHVVLLIRPQHEPARQPAEPPARMGERVVGCGVEDPRVVVVVPCHHVGTSSRVEVKWRHGARDDR